MPRAASKTRFGGESHRSEGCVLVGVQGEELPLRSVTIESRAEGGLAETVLHQVFENPYPEPLNVHYVLPLPAGGAVAGFTVEVGDKVIRGGIDRRERARERFEQAQIEGRTAGLLDQERPDVFTQNLGNLPPEGTVSVEVTVHHKLTWLPEGLWEWRFPTVVAPRYLGAEGRVPDAGRMTVDVAEGGTGPKATLKLTIADEVHGTGPLSTSHELSVSGDTVGFAGSSAALDRDIVVAWGAARPRPGVHLQRARPPEASSTAGSAYGLLTVVPPAVADRVVPRDLIVLLDTSGSMLGTPLERAKQVVCSLIDSLTDRDRLQLVAFASSPEHWRRTPVTADADARGEAQQWVKRLQAGGATEMVEAITAALRPLRPDAQRQVVLVSDGLIGFETEAIGSICDGLPRGSRLHCVGVGSATNGAFLQSAARAGRGTVVAMDLDADPRQGVARLIAATRGPVVVELKVEGSAVEDVAPRRPTDLMKDSPVLIGVRLRPEGGELLVSGTTAEGPWEARVPVPPTPFGEGPHAVSAVYANEAVEDLELRLAAGGERASVDAAIEKLGLGFQVATRLTSWVAISQEPTVDTRQPVRVERIPQRLPYGMSAEGLGLRAVTPSPTATLDCLSFDAMEYPSSPEMPSRVFRKYRLLPPDRRAEDGDRRTFMARLRDEVRRLTRRLSDLYEGARGPRNDAGRTDPVSADVKLDAARLQAQLELLEALLHSEQGLEGSTLARGAAHPSPDGDGSIVQFSTDIEMDWNPPVSVLLLGRGGLTEVSSVPDASTGPGHVPAGSLVRIHVDVPIDRLRSSDVVLVLGEAISVRIHLQR